MARKGKLNHAKNINFIRTGITVETRQMPRALRLKIRRTSKTRKIILDGSIGFYSNSIGRFIVFRNGLIMRGFSVFFQVHKTRFPEACSQVGAAPWLRRLFSPGRQQSNRFFFRCRLDMPVWNVYWKISNEENKLSTIILSVKLLLVLSVLAENLFAITGLWDLPIQTSRLISSNLIGKIENLFTTNNYLQMYHACNKLYENQYF